MPTGDRSMRIIHLILLVLLGTTPASGHSDNRSSLHANREAGAIYVDVQASSWKPRGRILYDITGSIRSKLSDAGLEVVRTSDQERDLVLSVAYRESQGEQYAINSYGTVITCTLSLLHEGHQPIFGLTIEESSHPSAHGTPPYLDALERFQTNPYYFFLGPIVAGRLRSRLDPVDGLVDGLRQQAIQAIKQANSSSDSESNYTHTMPPADKVYASEAAIRAVEELGRLKHTEAIPVLLTLLEYPDPRVRAKTREVLESLEARTPLATDPSHGSPS